MMLDMAPDNLRNGQFSSRRTIFHLLRHNECFCGSGAKRQLRLKTSSPAGYLLCS